MASIPTIDGGDVLVSSRGRDEVRLTVTDPMFGTIATIKLEHRHAAMLASAIDVQLVAGDVGGADAARVRLAGLVRRKPNAGLGRR